MAAPAFRAAPVRIRVPATSANLGPGFDALGLALTLYDDVVVRIAESGLTVDIAGEGADELRRDKRNLVVRAIRATFDLLGGQPRGLEVVCANRIPQSRGLGSSAAAVVAGITAARALVVAGFERVDDAAALRLATELEGHPDNVAACLRGGLTLAWSENGPHAVSLDVRDSLVPVVFVPTTKSSTSKTRRLLPETVPHGDAAFVAGRSALLVEALSRRPELLLPATVDRIHQQYRASAMPRTAKLVERLRESGIAAVVSGAGPTVLALTQSSDEAAAAAGIAGAPWTVHELEIDREGARTVPVDS
jgi:homoserine kinase